MSVNERLASVQLQMAAVLERMWKAAEDKYPGITFMFHYLEREQNRLVGKLLVEAENSDIPSARGLLKN
jgi:hypothetical protein